MKLIHYFSYSKTCFCMVLLVSMFTFPRVVSLLNTKYFSRGEMPGNAFYVAVVTSGNSKQFHLVRLVELHKASQLVQLPFPYVRTQVGEFETEEYRVLQRSKTRMAVETVRRNDDYTFTSRYVVEGNTVIPLMQNTFGVGDVLTGSVVSVIFCLILFLLLRRFNPR